MTYSLSIELEALRFLLSLNVVRRAKLFGWIERLEGAPFSKGQAVAFDPTGREIQVSKVGRFLVFHWTDHAVRSVRVIKIELNA